MKGIKNMKVNLFKLYQDIQESLRSQREVPKMKKQWNEHKKKYHCFSCSNKIPACEINGKQLTGKQASNKFKAISPDGNARCQTCMIKWLEGIIDECI